jgi:hypothetical protein
MSLGVRVYMLFRNIRIINKISLKLYFVKNFAEVISIKRGRNAMDGSKMAHKSLEVKKTKLLQDFQSIIKRCWQIVESTMDFSRYL